ncbi:MAG: exonuclease SbcCD subunit D [Oscillospiraceae bacterium]|nr:exonuclease SbcCD subunit D [Oscillospiraceae bacterium]
MKILHTSDLHLGISLFDISLIEYQKLLPELIAGAVSESGADVVVISGDVFDSALSSAEAISVYNGIVSKLCMELKKKTIICAGNHDGAARLSACRDVLAAGGLYVYGRLEIPVKPLEIGNCNFYTLPFFNADDARRFFPETEIKDICDAMKAVIESIKENFEQGKKNILIAHCAVIGGEISESDRAMQMGGAAVIPSELFKDFDYVALGHLHKPQTIGGNVRYSGTPFKYSFSEKKHKKSFSVFDSDTGDISEIAVNSPYDVEEIEDTYENLIAGQRRDDNVFLKIKIKDRFLGGEIYSILKERYPKALKIEGQEFKNEEASISMDKAQSLSPLELAKIFYKDQTGLEITEEGIKWFEEALSGLLEGGEQQ